MPPGTQIIYLAFLLLSFLLLFHGAVSDSVNKDPKNEVPILHKSEKSKIKVTQQPKQSEEEKETEDIKNVNISVNGSSNSAIVPETNETVPESIEEDVNETADDVENAENSPEIPTSKPKDKSKIATKGAENLIKPTVENLDDGSDAKGETLVPENKDVDSNNKSNLSDSNTVTNSTDNEDNLKPDVDKTTHKVVLPQITSPSLSEENSKTENSPTEYFATLNPKGIDTESASGFSFFRLFILTTVFFFILYVGYYYRHKIKRRFGNNGNEIYYHPLRTMQHNAVD
ncbi:hypothetical protein ACHWQZ_G009665 [Mnemiopsis leidyi]